MNIGEKVRILKLNNSNARWGEGYLKPEVIGEQFEIVKILEIANTLKIIPVGSENIIPFSVDKGDVYLDEDEVDEYVENNTLFRMFYLLSGQALLIKVN